MSNAPTRRPRSISEVALRAIAGTDLFDHSVREFLDSFYLMHDAAEREAALRDEPPPVGERQDAYLAAVAEHLARRYHLEIPDWTEKPERFLRRPFFAGGLESLKATLLVESPVAFRRRLLFVSENALSRPREFTAKERQDHIDPAADAPGSRR